VAGNSPPASSSNSIELPRKSRLKNRMPGLKPTPKQPFENEQISDRCCALLAAGGAIGVQNLPMICANHGSRSECSAEMQEMRPLVCYLFGFSSWTQPAHYLPLFSNEISRCTAAGIPGTSAQSSSSQLRPVALPKNTLLPSPAAGAANVAASSDGNRLRDDTMAQTQSQRSSAASGTRSPTYGGSDPLATRPFGRCGLGDVPPSKHAAEGVAPVLSEEVKAYCRFLVPAIRNEVV
jgi:hypothetical protein